MIYPNQLTETKSLQHNTKRKKEERYSEDYLAVADYSVGVEAYLEDLEAAGSLDALVG